MAKRPKSYRKTIRVNGKPVAMRFSTKQDADDWYQEMLRQKRRSKAGLESEFEPTEIEHVAADFIRSRMNLETWRHDKFRLETYFFPRFRGRMIHSITRKEWKEAMDDLIKIHGLKPKTYNNIRTMLSVLYNHAIKDEPKRAVANPILEINPLPVIQEGIEFFHTEEQCQRYLTYSQLENPMFGMFAFIALNTGMREGEIIALDNDSVDLKHRTIHVWRCWSHSERKIVERTKGKRHRRIGINETLANAFKRHLAWSPFKATNELVVCNKSGRALESKHLWEMHSKVIAAANLRYMNIHCLRHTYATQFLSKGGSIWDLRNVLGHQSITTTERYAHVVPMRVQERANVFEVGVTADATVTPKEPKKNATA